MATRFKRYFGFPAPPEQLALILRIALEHQHGLIHRDELAASKHMLSAHRASSPKSFWDRRTRSHFTRDSPESFQKAIQDVLQTYETAGILADQHTVETTYDPELKRLTSRFKI